MGPKCPSDENGFQACGKIKTKSLKSAKFQFQLFLTTLNIMSSLHIVTKRCCRTLCSGVHSHCNSNFKTFKLK